MKTAVLATTRGIVLTFRAAPPNNQSLTRLVLSESSDVTADIANTDRPLLAKLWHVGLASILLNYLPAWPGVVLSLRGLINCPILSSADT